MTSDLVLLRRYHHHADAFAFRELVQAHAGMVFATARRITRDPALAEDVAQETFLELARHAATVRESVGAWLHRVAWRRACNAVRDASTRRRLEAAAASEAPPAEQGEATWEELEPLIDAALDALPDKLRGPLVEHFLAGRSQQEIAARFGVSQPTVSRWVDSGIERLRAHLRAHGVAAGGALALVLASHAGTPAPAGLVASLGKIAVSGVAGAVARDAGTGPSVWWRARRVTTVGTIVALAVAGGWYFSRGRAGDERTSKGAANAGGPITPELQTWQGRAFCPECAPPRIDGRVPAHGIFVHVENGREVIYDLTLPQPVPDFHARLCLPSMSDVHAVQLRGTPGMRDGRLALTVAMLEPRRR